MRTKQIAQVILSSSKHHYYSHFTDGVRAHGTKELAHDPHGQAVELRFESGSSEPNISSQLYTARSLASSISFITNLSHSLRQIIFSLQTLISPPIQKEASSSEFQDSLGEKG